VKRTTEDHGGGHTTEVVELERGERIPAAGTTKKDVVGPGRVTIYTYPDGGRDMVLGEGCRLVYKDL
jgi:hypothetical protein